MSVRFAPQSLSGKNVCPAQRRQVEVDCFEALASIQSVDVRGRPRVGAKYD